MKQITHGRRGRHFDILYYEIATLTSFARNDKPPSPLSPPFKGGEYLIYGDVRTLPFANGDVRTLPFAKKGRIGEMEKKA
jgi:hypothetical protein